MNFVASAAANGTIGYDEYSYPLDKNYPVVKIEQQGRLLHAARRSTTSRSR